MRVQLVSIRPTAAAEAAGRTALTPELLAATGARYSRNNEGVDSIVEKIDFDNIDASVDGIFRMVDYGHQSIADMAPIAIFIDGVSILLAYLVWSWSPLAGGQESSTRYIELSLDGMIDPELLGIPRERRESWREAMEGAFTQYRKLEAGWRALSEFNPGRMRIPEDLSRSEEAGDRRKVERLRRNYAFDRARYLLPSAASTNLMLVMSARAWASLCQHLCSHYLPEARALGENIGREMRYGAPRLMRHATAKESIRRGLSEEFDALSHRARAEGVPETLQEGAARHARPSGAWLEAMPPPGLETGEFSSALRHHDNRYAWIGAPLRRTAVRFGWDAVAFGDIRDLNRHRTGTKHVDLLPVGFYAAADQLPESHDDDAAHSPDVAVKEASEFGREISGQAFELLCAADTSYLYWTLLGTQFPFEHTTTADKFIYEAELRTGAGAHFRYAKHLSDALACWHRHFPETRGHVIEGQGEPE